VIPVSDLDAAKAVYTALLGAPHTDESYYVGYNINGFEVGLNPAGEGGDRWPSPTSRIST
jgi:catechol 2,3-dioxygenase-like lactoylglutathione lyase family enzyme